MTMVGMNTPNRLHDCAVELLEGARAFQAAAEQPGSHMVATASLERQEEALRLLSAAWYQLAADASPLIVERRLGSDSKVTSRPRVDGLSREQEARLVGSLHDVAAAFARCARSCREGRSTVAPIITQRVATGRTDDRRHDDQFPRLKRHERPRQRVA
jgi:hypothetical protein